MYNANGLKQMIKYIRLFHHEGRIKYNETDRQTDRHTDKLEDRQGNKTKILKLLEL